MLKMKPEQCTYSFIKIFNDCLYPFKIILRFFNRVNVEEKNDVDADHEMPDFERMSRMGGMIPK